MRQTDRQTDGRTDRSTIIMRCVHKSEGDEGADDDERVENVPQVAAVGARVKQYSTIDHLQQTHRSSRHQVIKRRSSSERETRPARNDLASISSTDNDA